MREIYTRPYSCYPSISSYPALDMSAQNSQQFSSLFFVLTLASLLLFRDSSICFPLCSQFFFTRKNARILHTFSALPSVLTLEISFLPNPFCTFSVVTGPQKDCPTSAFMILSVFVTFLLPCNGDALCHPDAFSVDFNGNISFPDVPLSKTSVSSLQFSIGHHYFCATHPALVASWLGRRLYVISMRRFAYATIQLFTVVLLPFAVLNINTVLQFTHTLCLPLF